MSMDYTFEKLRAAVDTLVGSGTIQQRLEYAAESLIRLGMSDKDPAFPNHPDLQQRLDAVIRSLTSTPAVGDEGKIAASTRALSDEDGARLAKEILSLYGEARDLVR